MDFYLKIPAGKDPGNLRVHPCPALELSTRRNGEEFKIGRHLSQVQLLIQERDPTIFGVSQGSLHQFSSQRFHLVSMAARHHLGLKFIEH